MMRIAITSSSGATVIRADLARHDLLLLMLSHRAIDAEGSGLMLRPEPEPGALMYALLRLRKGRLHGLALREEVTLHGLDDAWGSSNARIIISHQRFDIRLEPAQAFLRRRPLIRLAGVIVVGGSLAAVLGSGVVPLSHQTPARIIPVSSASPSRELTMPVSRTDAIQEAKNYMQQGDEVQAKLALLEGIERNPSDLAARHFLEAMEKGGKTGEQLVTQQERVEVSREQIDTLMRGEVLLAQGRKLIEGGRYAEALSALRAAEQEVGSLLVAGPLRTSLDAAKEQAEQALRRLGASKLDDFLRQRERLGREGGRSDFAKMQRLLTEGRALQPIFPEHQGLRRSLAWLRGRRAEIFSMKLLSAETVERFSGCTDAMPLYQEMLQELLLEEVGSRERVQLRIRACQRNQRDAS